ncbi:MAG TPA: hypothetical protein VND19_14640 [Acetobacteraceae bacterium]|nr:hypothetical protein [Acetobacteraceae bacterium]
MTRSAAAKATQAADAVLDWLRRQPPPVFPPARRGPPDPTPTQPEAGATDAPPRDAPSGAEDAAAQGTQQTDVDGAVDPAAVASAPTTPAPTVDGIATRPRPATAPDAGGHCRDAPLRLAHTDWLHHRLEVVGPAVALAALQAAAAGAGVIPWHLDADRIEEDCFHLLVAPPPPQQRSLSLTGARIVAGQLRAAVARRHDLAVGRVGRSRACPFDLHALVPVPGEILRRGPDDAASQHWLWQHWGTTRELRHVAAEAAASQDPRRQPNANETGFRVTFWSADWSPWRALAAVGGRFPALRFELHPSYDAP